MNVSLSQLNAFQVPAAADTQVAPAPAPEAETASTTASATASASLGKLSVNDQIRQLKEQGQTLSQISVDLDLSISAVGNDLLINVPKIPAITQTPQANATPSISLSA